MIRTILMLLLLLTISNPPTFLIVRFAMGDCQIWYNIAPPMPPYQVMAKADTPNEAWVKLQTLYARRWCL
jgi:hypothetical protein